MTDDEVRDLFDGLDAPPPPAFVAALRDDLSREWSQPGAAVAPLRAVPNGPRRRWTWPATAAALALVVVGAAVMLQGDDRPGRVDAGPAAPGTVATAPGVSSTTVAPSTSPGSGSGIWPFTNDAELAAAPADSPFRDAEVTAREFARVYLGITDRLSATGQTAGTNLVTVELRRTTGEGGTPWADAPVMTTVSLVRVSAAGPWTVIGARSPRIVAAHEFDQQEFASPMRVVGQANAYEGTVSVEVREDGMVSGQALGRGFVTGRGDSDGSLGPFDGEVAFRTPTRPAGAVVLYESSAADGSLLQVTVVRISFARP